MGTRIPDGIPRLPPDQAEVVAWLRTPDGERWSERRIGTWLEQHADDAGVFASVLRDGSAGAKASWPDPGGWYDLGDE